MGKLWFRSKTYGWGWYPSSWEGWFALFIFTVLLVANIFSLDTSSQDIPTWFFIRTGALVFILLLICWLKGETPRWRWGKDT